MSELKIISNDTDKDVYDNIEDLSLDNNTLEIFNLIHEKIEKKCIEIIKSLNKHKPKLKFNDYNIRSEHETRGWCLESFEAGYDSIIINIGRYTGGGNSDSANFSLSNKILNLSTESIDEFFSHYDAKEEKVMLDNLLKKELIMKEKAHLESVMDENHQTTHNIFKI